MLLVYQAVSCEPDSQDVNRYRAAGTGAINHEVRTRALAATSFNDISADSSP